MPNIKLAIFPMLSVQFSGVKDIGCVHHPSPKLFHYLCVHYTITLLFFLIQGLAI
jgi:hypothetical protein